MDARKIVGVRVSHHFLLVRLEELAPQHGSLWGQDRYPMSARSGH